MAFTRPCYHWVSWGWQMAKRVNAFDGNTYKVATSHLITTCATLAAIMLFVFLGAKVLPGAVGLAVREPSANVLVAAFLLNIAIVLFGWRRAGELASTLAILKQAEHDAYVNAYTDHTTGLPNRRALTRELEGGFKQASDGGVLILIDVDHFKKVNDLYGHSAGDELLQHVARTLVERMPSSSFVARLGGDEFAALIPSRSDAERAAQELVRSFAEPTKFGSYRTQLSLSVGIAPLPSDCDAIDVLRHADVAMYSVKQSGRNGFAWYDVQMEQQIQARVVLEEEIRAAIEGDEFVPFFQPLISLDTGELNGFEVLARWKSPRRGLIEPAEFIGVAEQSGQISALSMRVMEKAFVEARDWPVHLKLAVNISPVQFRDPRLAERVVKILTETGFAARRLEVEITEGSLMEDREQALTIIQSLRNAGIAIALDDFGTGYASLSQLHALPFDRIKIDRSFINSLAANEQSAAIVETIAALGKTLHVPITAEGVESDAIREKLAALGCQDAQGWLFGRAVSGHVATMQLDAYRAAQPAEQHQPKIEPLEPLNKPGKSDNGRAAAARKW